VIRFEHVYDGRMFEGMGGAQLAAAVAGVDPCALPPDEALDYALAAAKVVGWATAAEAAGLARMHATYPADGLADAGVGHGLDPDRLAVAEVRAAYGVSQLAAGHRLGFADGLAALPRLTDALRTGLLGLDGVRVLVRESEPLAADPSTRRDAVDTVLDAHLSDLDSGGSGLTVRQATLRIRRAVLAADPDRAEREAHRARKRRRVWHQPDPAHAEGVFALAGPVERTTECEAAVDALARAWRAAGVTGTLDQLRFDAAHHLLTTRPAHGTGAADTGTGDDNPGDAGHGDGQGHVGHGDDGDVDDDDSADSSDRAEARPRDGDAAWGRVGGPSADPPASAPGSRATSAGGAAGSDVESAATERDAAWTEPVPDPTPPTETLDPMIRGVRSGQWVGQVTVPLSTLLGLDDAPGEIAGVGPVPASVARSLMAQATVWRRLLTDPADGHLVTQKVRSYRPTQAMRDFVLARTGGVCSARGCGNRRGVQVDHVDAFPRGPTSGTNLDPECTPDHNGKTHGRWVHALLRGGLAQTSPLGKHYLTRPTPLVGSTGLRTRAGTDADTDTTAPHDGLPADWLAPDHPERPSTEDPMLDDPMLDDVDRERTVSYGRRGGDAWAREWDEQGWRICPLSGELLPPATDTGPADLDTEPADPSPVSTGATTPPPPPPDPEADGATDQQWPRVRSRLLAARTAERRARVHRLTEARTAAARRRATAAAQAAAYATEAPVADPAGGADRPPAGRRRPRPARRPRPRRNRRPHAGTRHLPPPRRLTARHSITVASSVGRAARPSVAADQTVNSTVPAHCTPAVVTEPADVDDGRSVSDPSESSDRFQSPDTSPSSQSPGPIPPPGPKPPGPRPQRPRNPSRSTMAAIRSGRAALISSARSSSTRPSSTAWSSRSVAAATRASTTSCTSTPCSPATSAIDCPSSSADSSSDSVTPRASAAISRPVPSIIP